MASDGIKHPFDDGLLADLAHGCNIMSELDNGTRMRLVDVEKIVSEREKDT